MSPSRSVGDSLVGFERLITQNRVNEYAEASGDHNPIHLDEAYAASTQFGTRIAHGMLSLALVTEMLAAEFPATWHSGGKIKIRFSAPVIPGETVTTYGEITSINETESGLIATCSVGCKKPDGNKERTRLLDIQPVGKPSDVVQRPGPRKPGTQDKHGRHRDGRLVGKSGQRLGRRQNTGKREADNNEERGEFDAEPLRHKQDHGRGENEREHYDVHRHPLGKRIGSLLQKNAVGATR